MRFLGAAARAQLVALPTQCLQSGLVDAATLGFLECLLDLEHLGEQARGGFGLDRFTLLRVASLFEAKQILDPSDGVTQRAVRGVDQGGCAQGPRLILRRGTQIKVRVMLAG